MTNQKDELNMKKRKWHCCSI